MMFELLKRNVSGIMHVSIILSASATLRTFIILLTVHETPLPLHVIIHIKWRRSSDSFGLVVGLLQKGPCRVACAENNYHVITSEHDQVPPAQLSTVLVITRIWHRQGGCLSF